MTRVRSAGRGGAPCLPLALELIVVTTEPLSGTVAVAGSDRRQEFHGWIDLMGAVSVLCADEGPAAPPPGPSWPA
jgi:hypothetical protein